MLQMAAMTDFLSNSPGARNTHRRTGGPHIRRTEAKGRVARALYNDPI
jgi:hypothetical protein